MNWLKKLWLFFISIGITVFIIAPFIINVGFQKTAPFPWLVAEWEASDALLYFGSVIGGIGTIFLGAITIQQTTQINKRTSEHENANTKRPFFIIEEVCFSKSNGTVAWGHGQNGFVSSYTKSQYAFIKIVNIGDGVANNLVIEPWGFGEIPKENRPAFCIPPLSFCTIPVFLTKQYGNEHQFVNVIYENLIGYAYSQKIELRIDFNPQVVSETALDTDEHIPEYQEQFHANVFNIYPQTTVGMNRYDRAKGTYTLGDPK